jgi:hypothetical protein
MTIQIGKKYSVSPPRYGYEELSKFNKFRGGDKKVDINTSWKGGTLIVTPINNEEVEKLNRFKENGPLVEVSPYDEFQSVDFDSCHAGQIADTEYSGWTEEEELDGTMDEVIEGIDSEGDDYLFENGWNCYENLVKFIGPWDVEEVQ